MRRLRRKGGFRGFAPHSLLRPTPFVSIQKGLEAAAEDRSEISERSSQRAATIVVIGDQITQTRQVAAAAVAAAAVAATTDGRSEIPVHLRLLASKYGKQGSNRSSDIFGNGGMFPMQFVFRV